MHGKYIFTQESFNLQGILNDINEQNTSFLDCKHKHMMKSGAPPDKVTVLYHLLPIESLGFTSRINSKGYHSMVPFLIRIFISNLKGRQASHRITIRNSTTQMDKQNSHILSKPAWSIAGLSSELSNI